MLPFIAVTALGLVVAVLGHLWLGLFEHKWVGGLVGFGLLLAYGLIYDRRQARKRRDTPDFRPPRE